MFQFTHYITEGVPEKLVVFLHGYNGDIEDHFYAIEWFRRYLKNCCLVVPHAPEICDKNPAKKQWFGMIKYDTESKRTKKETTVEEIFSIYEEAYEEIKKNSEFINDFITKMQKDFSITDNRTYLVGFSQGAMLTISTALTRKNNLGGAFVLSGLAAAKNHLEKNITAHPEFYLFHGEKDMKVQYKTVATGLDWLKKNHIVAHLKTYDSLEHKINEDEVEEIANIINND